MHAPAGAELALHGEVDVSTLAGTVRCRPAFQLVADLCRTVDPRAAAEITGVAADAIEAAARTLWESRPWRPGSSLPSRPPRAISP